MRIFNAPVLRRALSEWVFPSGLYCAACGNLIDTRRTYGLCNRCVREIQWGMSGPCAEQHSFDKGYACAVYEGRAADMIRDMKYRGKPWIARAIACAMRDRILADADPDSGELPSWDLIIPAPMHIIKRRKRGYDQAALIAGFLARETGTPYAEDLLIRSRKTDVMSALSADARRVNLLSAFRARTGAEAQISGRDILLVDDVYTTGSTADACAETLRSAGARRVDVFVFAAGVDKSRPGLWL